MARKSRKTSSFIVAAKEKVYRMAVYLRLSVEESSVYESESIQSQRRILSEYIQKHSDMEFVSEYIDDGKTGTNFDRPAFTKMLDDIRAGKIDGIIVKDLSRFGRNFEETEEYLLKVFPHLKIRFISVFDDYDSLYADADIILIAIKNLFNDFYAKDVSQKVSKSVGQLRKEGKYWGARPPYGYLIDPLDHHHLIIDEETVGYVKQIFSMAADRVSYARTIKWLHEHNVSPPMRRFHELGLFHSDKYKDLTRWYRSTIVNILENPVYFGALPIAKSKVSLWENIPYHKIAAEDWKCIENTHDAIISKEEYQLVQKIMDKKRKVADAKQEQSEKETKSPNPFPHKIFCGICKRSLIRNYFRTRKGKREYYFVCKDNDKTPGRQKCPNNYIRQNLLEKNLLEIIKAHIEVICEAGEIFKQYQYSAGTDTKQSYPSKLKQIQQKKAETETLKRDLYLDFKRGILSQEEYEYAKKTYTEQLKCLEAEQEQMENQLNTLETDLKIQHPIVYEAEKYMHMTTLTTEMVGTFIERIEVFPDRKITVKLKTADAFQELLQLMKTVDQGAKYYAE